MSEDTRSPKRRKQSPLDTLAGESSRNAAPPESSVLETEAPPSRPREEIQSTEVEDKNSDAGSSTSSSQPEDEETVPDPKFRVFQRVFARDNDGLMYEAVIRRNLYGPHYHKQVHMGMALSLQEADEQIDQYRAEEPEWHYFVHFNGWKNNWDRWVCQDDIYEINDSVRAHVERMQQEHAALRKSMTRKVSGKKGFQTIRGADFLREWRKKLDQLNSEMRIGDNNNTQREEEKEDKGKKPVKSNKKSTDEWNKATLDKETKLRDNGLTKKRTPTEASRIPLPFTLKKVLVEQWEIISQCEMVLCVPASVSVRDALNRYLESKGVQIPVDVKDGAASRGEGKEVATTTDEGGLPNVPDSAENTTNQMKPEVASESKVDAEDGTRTNRDTKKTDDGEPMNMPDSAAKNPPTMELVEKVGSESKVDIDAKSNMVGDGSEDVQAPPQGDSKSADGSASKVIAVEDVPATGQVGVNSQESPEKRRSEDLIKSSDLPETPSEKEDAKSRLDQEWIDMANGIALMFDEALPSRLLYQEELPQLHVLDSLPEYSEKRYSELYGCEHLLRLFVRLPPMLADAMPEEDARPIIAKVNDFVRFIHKNQASLLSQSYRKLNEAELKDQQKMFKNAERKRKRLEEENKGN